jgi:hypothetical protein
MNIIEQLEKEREKLLKQIEELKKAVKYHDDLISFYKDKGNFLPADYTIPKEDRSISIAIDPNNYPKNGTWKDKVLFILGNNKMRSSEIIETAKKYESYFHNDLDSIDKSIPQTLWALKNDAVILHEGKFYSLIIKYPVVK